jgi:protein SCO1/2
MPPVPSSEDPPRRRPQLGVILPIAAIVVVLFGVTLALAGKGHSKPKLPHNATTVKSASYRGATVSPRVPAPPIDLRNSLGKRVTMAQYRGKVALVTFLYVKCPDVCPLITTNLHATQAKLGARAKDIPIIAVSVDPHGDTRTSVAEFLRQHDMTGRMQYLIGSGGRLAETWKAWQVGSRRDTASPQLVAHSALVYGISASGRITTVYPANFKPADIVHDIPLLEHQ